MNPLESAEADLKCIVDQFNFYMGKWIKLNHCGANFDFIYDEDGNKKMTVRDLSPLPKAPEAPSVESAEATLREALETVLE